PNDEVFFPGTNVYSNSVEDVSDGPIPSEGSRDLPIALLTSSKLAPEAAEFAGVLRLSNRAWLWGEDILSSVAEASWIGIGASGIVCRGSLLGGANAPWPDVIPADRRTSSPEALLGDLPNLGQPPPVTERSNQRPTLIPFPARLLVEDTPVGLGQLQAGLI